LSRETKYVYQDRWEVNHTFDSSHAIWFLLKDSSDTNLVGTFRGANGTTYNLDYDRLSITPYDGVNYQTVYDNLVENTVYILKKVIDDTNKKVDAYLYDEYYNQLGENTGLDFANTGAGNVNKIWISDGTGSDLEIKFRLYYALIRKYADPEPTTTVGSEALPSPTKPALVEPSDYENIPCGPYGSFTITFKWTIGQYADNHRLLIDNDEDFLSPVENALLGGTENTYSVSNLNCDDYVWKVVAINPTGENASEIRHFKVYPNLVYPPLEDNENICSTRPTFAWLRGPGTFNLLVDDNNDFSSPVENVSVTNDYYTVTTYTIENSLPLGVYYWKVDDSPARSFRIVSPLEAIPLSAEGSARATAYPMSPKIIKFGSKTHFPYFDYENGDYKVYIRTYTGSIWKPPQFIGTAPDDHGGTALICDNEGYLYVVYGGHVLYQGRNYFQFRKSSNPNDSTSWENEENIEFYEDSEIVDGPTYPSVVADENYLHLFFRGDGPGDIETYYTKYHIENEWWDNTPVRLTDYDNRTIYGGRVAIDSEGNIHLVSIIWNYWNDTHDGVIYMRHNAGDPDNVWRRADGTILDIPVTPSNAENIYTGNAGGLIGIDWWDEPVVTVLEYELNQVIVFCWNGSSWDNAVINPPLGKKFSGITQVRAINENLLFLILVEINENDSGSGPSNRLYLYYSTDNGSTWTRDKMISRGMDCEWLPNIERDVGFNDNTTCRVIYQEGNTNGETKVYIFSIDENRNVVYYQPAGWNLIESWSGTINTIISWQLIEVWNGIINTSVGWNCIEEWTGNINTSVRWSLIDTWNGTVETTIGWNLIESWTGTINPPSVGWSVIESWNGTVGVINSAPNKPTSPSPADGATGVSTSPTLQVTVTDPDGDTMTVYFYDSGGNLIGTDTNVPSGGTASTAWSGLDYSTTYSWYTKAYDGSLWATSDTWSFTTMAPPKEEWRIQDVWAGTVKVRSWKVLSVWSGKVFHWETEVDVWGAATEPYTKLFGGLPLLFFLFFYGILGIGVYMKTHSLGATFVALAILGMLTAAVIPGIYTKLFYFVLVVLFAFLLFMLVRGRG